MSETYHDCMQEGDRFCRGSDYHCACLCYAKAATVAQQDGDARRELRAREALVVWKSNIGRWDATAGDARRLAQRAQSLHAAGQIRDDTVAYYQMCSDLRLAEALKALDCRNHWPEIKRLLAAARQTARHRHDAFCETYCVMNLGGCATRVGEYRKAGVWLDEAESLLRTSLSSQQYLPFSTYCKKSNLLRRLENCDEAIKYAQQGLQTAQTGGNPQYIAYAKLTLARALHARKKHREALSLLEVVLSEAMKHGWINEERKSGLAMAEVLTELRHLDQAELAARRALELAEELSLCEEEVKSLICLGRVLTLRHDRDETSRVLKRIEQLASQRNYPDHVKAAKELAKAVA